MILECPNCEVTYEIPVELPPEGRKVRCASCQHIWNATMADQPKPDIALPDFDDEEIVFKEEPEAPAEPETAAAEPEASVEEEAKPEPEPDDEVAADFDFDSIPVDEPDDKPDDEVSADFDFDSIPVDEPNAETELAEDPVADVVAEAEAEAAAEAKKEAEETVAEAPAEEAPEAVESEAEPEEAESPPIVIGKAKKRRGPMLGNIAAGWAALALVVTSITGFAYFQRISVVRALSGTASTYESIGLPVNVRGLEFKKVKYSWETSAGRPVLEVFGDIVNVTSKPMKVPTVVFGLRTKEKVEVYQWAADVRSELLPPGKSTAFTAQIPSPPKSIRDVQVRFAKVR